MLWQYGVLSGLVTWQNCSTGRMGSETWRQLCRRSWPQIFETFIQHPEPKNKQNTLESWFWKHGKWVLKYLAQMLAQGDGLGQDYIENILNLLKYSKYLEKIFWNILIYFKIFCAKAGVRRPQDEITSTLRWHLGEHPCTLTTFHTRNSHHPPLLKIQIQIQLMRVGLFSVSESIHTSFWRISDGWYKSQIKGKVVFWIPSIQLSPP